MFESVQVRQYWKLQYEFRQHPLSSSNEYGNQKLKEDDQQMFSKY